MVRLAPSPEVNATDLAVPESRVENHGGAKVRDAVRRVQSPHPTTVMQPRGVRSLRPQPWTPPARARTPRAPRTAEVALRLSRRVQGPRQFRLRDRLRTEPIQAKVA